MTTPAAAAAADCGADCAVKQPPAATAEPPAGQRHQQDDAEPPLITSEREVEVTEELTLSIGQQPALEGHAGVVCWDAGLVLAHFLIKQVEIGALSMGGLRVLELGSGTGLVGLTAAALGAQQVVLTDLPELLPLLNTNIQRNGLAHVAAAAALRWGVDDASSLPAPLAPPYDLVLASDVIYTPDAVPGLLATLAGLLRQRQRRCGCYLAVEMRQGAGLQQFFGGFSAHGLAGQLVEYTELHEDWCSPDLLVWRIAAAAAAAAAAPGDAVAQHGDGGGGGGGGAVAQHGGGGGSVEAIDSH